ncbi:hypothetical protein PR202_ga09698 [Eleusine coracana subsp. coracana]|uniref:Histidine-containing phosphotransfer protein n=1 Tax=Eleusine coracana subsp. coracana TaxID=191504 RepID=A0AAV5C4J3_ELECO|nr:hypothetical protein PR202_ga09698 [Eleusine coracana subsp. coracana]
MRNPRLMARASCRDRVGALIRTPVRANRGREGCCRGIDASFSRLQIGCEKYPKDFNRWDTYMQQLKGSCSSIGASRMKSECMSFREYCGQGNVDGSLTPLLSTLMLSSRNVPFDLCMRSFQKVKREHTVLRQKLEAYFQLLRQAGPAGAATRPAM